MGLVWFLAGNNATEERVTSDGGIAALPRQESYESGQKRTTGRAKEGGDDDVNTMVVKILMAVEGPGVQQRSGFGFTVSVVLSRLLFSLASAVHYEKSGGWDKE